MKNTILATAVLLAVGELRQAGKFSVLNITKKLREWANTGELELSDRTPEDVNGVNTYRIEHDEVKTIFNDMYNNSVIINLSRGFNGSYYEYADNGSASTVSSTSGWPKAIIAPRSYPKQPFVTKQTSDPFVQTILDYVSSCRSSGKSVSMKQVQSRFKGVSKTCQEYADILVRAGYVLSNASSPVSRQTV